MLRALDLFSGIGGFSLGLERTGGFETVGFCEIEDFPRRVLSKHWPNVPIYGDVRTLDHAGPVDVICGGYPCQPFSVAGERKGGEDYRHLWPSMLNLIQKHRPAWVIGENVAGHVSLGLDQVLSDLESAGYAARAFVIPACSVDAPHRRDRVWIIAHTDCKFVEGGAEGSDYGKDGSQSNDQHFERCGCGDGGLPRGVNAGVFKPGLGRMDDGIPRWLDEPLDVPRVIHGVKGRRQRIQALGNSIVPILAERIGNAILRS